MSHFYGNMKGSRGETTRCGDKHSGIQAHVRGWDIGCHAELTELNGEDRVHVYITGGSNSPGVKVYLGIFALREGEYVRITE